jgi:phospholipid N-methyltransferase
MTLSRKLQEYRAFLAAFVSKPMLTGSIVPSSSALARELLRTMNPEQVKLIVEVGPGTGAITHKILDSETLRSRYYGLDINPVFVEELRVLFPKTRFEAGSAEHLDDFLRDAGLGKSDFIVSGLPWSLIRPHRQVRILKNVFDALADDGEFVTFSYVHTPLMRFGRDFQRSLRAQFPSVRTSQIVWNNLPPAIVFRCRKN